MTSSRQTRAFRLSRNEIVVWCQRINVRGLCKQQAVFGHCAAQNAPHTLRLGVFTLPVAVLLEIPHNIFRVKVQPIGIPENIYRYVEDVATCFQSPSIEGLAHQLHLGTPFIPVHTV